MTPTDLAASAEDRSHFYWWLAQWFLAPPSPEQLAGLPAEVAEVANDPATEPADDLLKQAWLDLARASRDREALNIEYTRLFSGIQEGQAPPPPFESVWREDRLIGESTVQVIEAYAQAGFADIDPEAGPQDHVAVELKFIALLALREAEAWQADDKTGAHQRLIQQRDFLNQHLAIWAPRWADAIIEQARAPLFAALAGLIKAGIEQAARELNDLTRQTA